MNPDGCGKTGPTTYEGDDINPVYGVSPDIWIMEADGGYKRQLSTSASVSYLTWTPAGSKIVFSSSRDLDHELGW